MSVTGWIVGLFILLILIGIVVLAAREEEREKMEWQAFVDQNDCHVVEVKDAQSGTSIGPTIGFDGKLSMSTQTVWLAAQECWLCSNGVRYWKKAGMAVDRLKVR
ncbi:hypothetical protein [Neorhizobium petrolearium]|uniref:hypothetical protein n=1 Tax=Neorhizobium petrolearium TaxID=515361 RepID=UPI003F80B0E0